MELINLLESILYYFYFFFNLFGYHIIWIIYLLLVILSVILPLLTWSVLSNFRKIILCLNFGFYTIIKRIFCSINKTLRSFERDTEYSDYEQNYSKPNHIQEIHDLERTILSSDCKCIDEKKLSDDECNTSVFLIMFFLIYKFLKMLIMCVVSYLFKSIYLLLNWIKGYIQKEIESILLICIEKETNVKNILKKDEEELNMHKTEKSVDEETEKELPGNKISKILNLQYT